PTTPAFVKGVVDLRGSAIAVIDLGAKLSQCESVPTPLSCIVIIEATLEGAAVLMGLMVDSVRQVLAPAPGEVQPPPPLGPGISPAYLEGVARDGTGFVLLLDIDHVLSAEEMLVVASIEEIVRALEAQATTPATVAAPTPTEPVAATTPMAPVASEARVEPVVAERPAAPEPGVGSEGRRRRRDRPR